MKAYEIIPLLLIILHDYISEEKDKKKISALVTDLVPIAKEEISREIGYPIFD